MPMELHALISSMLILKCKCRHLLRTTPIHDMHFRRAQPNGSNRRINRRVPRSHYYDASRNCRQGAGLITRDEIKRIRHSVKPFTSDAKPMNCPEPDSKKDHIVFLL